MKVELNGVSLSLFQGAKVKHALLAYDEEVYRQVVEEKAVVVDPFGNEVELSGALDPSFSYTVKDR
ncbi:hypothetical protein P4637_10185 [Halalkalibacterium halodurans]|jgi:hypothetical protein|uniref:BH2876 protein n=2 Tax=Halalkalibacterium halodurans TaxID=86665 RepID=Q9K8X6_HALH5|nr:hypothetical protein [Halalkalibacterium halodurans]MDY7223429.1 hypothetical protein [Halalkalibacterium halodurans]MDY7242650.1 hypothetical protein [Halalkalibacterium halodurans]MED3647341.1 hypothetical protein [Halalkalibacterium halodurans]MED4081643.1 hypothetical protein [Halalkalibacterium halodurans]MED4085196.1 hypothetical protein [Halalkalibacterium halodurans]